MFLGIGVGLPLNPVPVRFKLNVAVGPHIYLGRGIMRRRPRGPVTSDLSTCTVPFWAGGNADTVCWTLVLAMIEHILSPCFESNLLVHSDYYCPMCVLAVGL